MPELPEVEVLARFLDAHLAGRTVERCAVASLSALKTFDPPLSQLVGRAVTGCQRRGKMLCLDVSGTWLVIHLARGGWVRWYDTAPDTRVRPGKGPLALRVVVSAERELQRPPGFDVTEAGTEKRLALWVVRAPAEVEAVAALGPDPLDPALTPAELARRLADAGGTLKTALTRQTVVAGVGNAYSDEVLHRARLSPFKPAARLSDVELTRLHQALVTVLSEAVARAGTTGPRGTAGIAGSRGTAGIAGSRGTAGIAGSRGTAGIAGLKGDKHRSLRVHGRTGQPCPDCGDVIRQVAYATRSLQYCPTCQTGGRVLADRRLSRLLR